MNEIKCAIYARYSSNNQREASIEDQIRKCKELAASKGWIVLDEHIYFDKAQSGTQIDSRINLKKMLRVAMSENCPFQKILVDDTSRIARNTKEDLNIFSLLNFYGIHIYYVAQGIDTAYETAEEIITINGLIDSIYIRNLAKETHRGIEGQVLKGFSAGGKRYGYYSVPVYNGKVDIYGNPLADGYILKINPEEAETVIRIFRLFGEEGYSAKKIANLLNKELKEKGKPKPPRGDFWTVSTIIGSKKSLRGILNNEIYIGRYRWNRTSVKRNPENGTKKRILKDNSKWIEIIKPELRIISDELWEKVKRRQRYLKETANGKYVQAKKVYSKNLFTGLISCGLCNGNIVVVSGGKYAKYGCSNNWNKGSSVCENIFKINKNTLESAIFDSLKLDFTEKKIC
ncbi:recombinase family protein [Thermodesulfovibrio sp.]|uniref:recombinase family protein n=1 Tax=Thermodesulfovibrio sp. TaxID=2067987 RepID=UPI0030ACC07C